MKLFNERQNQALAGGMTRSIQTVLSNPIIVIKTRFEVVGFNQYNSITDACK
jgi:hypothetical protein